MVPPRIAVAVVLVCAFPAGAAAQADFRRGDVNIDGVVDIADAEEMVRVRIAAADHPTCLVTMDANDDNGVNISDFVFLAAYLFLGGFAPWPPGPDTPGPDPTPGGLVTCLAYSPTPGPTLATFSLGFECPVVPAGQPGETVELQAYVTLTTAGNTIGQGAGAWSISIGAENLRILSVTTAGTAAASVIDNPPGYRGENGFALGGVVDPELDIGAGPQGEGVVSGVGLYNNVPVATLPPDGTVRVGAGT